MLDVVNTIVPVFLVILLGYFLHAKELFPSPIVGPLNRLVFYLAIPAMIFREISRVSFAAYCRRALRRAGKSGKILSSD